MRFAGPWREHEGKSVHVYTNVKKYHNYEAKKQWRSFWKMFSVQEA
jgi:hypothetical protein